MKAIIILALLVAMPAEAQTATRGEALAAWGKAHARDVAGFATLEQVRDASATALGAMRDGEVATTAFAATDTLIEAGDYPPALALSRRTLTWAIARKTGTGDQYDAHTRIGSILYYMADYDGAARALGAAADAAARIAPLDLNAVANARANFAVVLDEAGRFRESRAALTAAIAERRRASPFRPGGTGVALAALAAVEKRLGRADLSDARYREALETMERGDATATASYAMILHNYAVFLGEQGRSEDAVRLYRSALARIPAERRFAPNMIPDHSGLAASLIQTGRLDEAEAALTDALAIADKLDKPTQDVSAAYGHRSALWEARGDFDRAEADARRALAIDLALRGSDRHLSVVRDLDGLVRILLRRGRTDEAETFGQRAEAALTGLPPRNDIHALVLDGRAATLAARGESAIALGPSRRASELLLVRLRDEDALEARGLTPAERAIADRRIELLWSNAGRVPPAPVATPR